MDESEFKIQMPKLGESVQEATITQWFVAEGDRINEDDPLFEVASDKVDSEVPSPVDGYIKTIFYPSNSIVPVGEVVAIISIQDDTKNHKIAEKDVDKALNSRQGSENQIDNVISANDFKAKGSRFYSPLVRTIARAERVSTAELETITGSGIGGRVQKNDILSFIESRRKGVYNQAEQLSERPAEPSSPGKVTVSLGAYDQVVEMDRVRRIIADHMVMSKQVSPHVTTVVEADVTNLVLWRNKIKDSFQAIYGEKITYLPVFTEAVAKAITEFPILNSSVDGHKIIMHRDINIGIAVAKPDGHLVVPVVKNAEQKNLLGLVKNLNQLAEAARQNKLAVEDYQGGTFTITNFGSFRNLIGTPIINQPQVAILATGSIEKKPAVMETPTGDAIVVRHKMFLSLTYDHRIIDGAIGGAFIRRIADILEDFDINRKV